MKRFFSLVICLSLVLPNISSVSYAAAATASDYSANKPVETEALVEENINELDLFTPLVVSNGVVTQNGEEVDSLTEDGTVMVDVNALTNSEQNTEKSDEITVVSEKTEIKLSVDSKKAEVVSNSKTETVTLDEKVVEKDDTVYVPLDSVISQLDGFTTVDEDEGTVYLKPFQTKRLIVDSVYIPKVSETSRVKNDDGTVTLTFDSEEATEKAYKTISNAPFIKSVSGENVYSVSELKLKTNSFPMNENYSWGADFVDSPQAVQYAKENNYNDKITVAVIDSGVDKENSLVKDRISEASKPLYKESTLNDNLGHGTHVAGIIADNTSENVEILAIKAVTDAGYVTDSVLRTAIKYAMESGADVINMSLSGFDYWTEKSLKNAVKEAYDSGITLVCSSGNLGWNADEFFPANSPYCITVAASNVNGEIVSFSNYGTCVNVSAPGVSILSSFKRDDSGNEKFEYFSGTSMAAPFVSAACSMILTFDNNQTPEEVTKVVTDNVTPYTADSSGKYYGTGIVSFENYLPEKRTEPVIFSELGGYYTNEFSVSLRSETKDAVIFYTLDGSVPTDKNGILYTSPIKINENTQIKAVAYSKSLYKSRYSKAYYHFDNYDLEDQFIVDENGYITKYTGYFTELAVQDEIGGKKIIGIGDNAFRYKTLQSISLPDSVKTLGDSAFSSTKLLSIHATGVTNVGKSCFTGCQNLENVEIKPLENIGEGAFGGCSKINETIIDITNLKTIPRDAFKYTGFSDINNCKSLTEIGEEAFCGTKIVNINLPSVKIVKDRAFIILNLLENVTLPNAEEIGGDAFSDNSALKYVSLPEVKTIGYRAFALCGNLSSFSAPKVQTIKRSALAGASSITELDFPELTDLEESAFSQMYSLKSVNIPSCKVIPWYCFFRDISLEKIPETVETIGNGAFSGCEALKNVNLKNVTTVEESTFDNCISLTTLEVPNAVEIKSSMVNSPHIVSLNFPNAWKVGSISGCVNLKTVSLPKAVSLGGFKNSTSLTTVSAPNVKEITGDFQNCTSLENIDFYNVKTLPGNAFENCTSLKEAHFPLLTKMGNGAFNGCTSLKFIDLSSLTSYANYYDSRCGFFENCTSLEYVLIPNVTLLDNMTVKNVPMLKRINCDSLKKFSMPASTTDSKTDSNVYFRAPELQTAIVNSTFLMSLSLSLPKGATVKVYKVSDFYKNPGGSLTVYTDSKDNVDVNPDVNPDVNITIKNSPEIVNGLSSEYAVETDSRGLCVNAVGADISYSWFYSSDGKVFNEITNAVRNNYMPDKNGYYYCKINDSVYNTSISSAVCKVSLKTEVSRLTFNVKTNVNVCCNGEMYENIAPNETLNFPAGAKINVLYNGKFSSAKLSDNKVIHMNGGNISFSIVSDDVFTEIDEITIEKCSVTMKTSDDDRIYTGLPIVPDFTVTYGEKTLKKDVDYTVECANNINAGTANYLICGIGDISGNVTGNFTVLTRDLSDCVISEIHDMQYTGELEVPEFSVKYNGMPVTYGCSRSISDSKLRPGTVIKLVLYGIDNFGGRFEMSYKLCIFLDTAEITVADTAELTGKSAMPGVKIRYGSDYLKEGTDFTLELLNNDKLGKATAIIKGLGKFGGPDVKVNFTVVPADISKHNVKISKKEYTFTGREIKPTVTVDGVDSSLYTVSYKNNVKIGKASVTVKAAGSAKGEKTAEFNIVAPKIAKVTGLKVTGANTSAIRLNWTKVSGATGYQIYDSKLKKTVATVKTNTALIEKLKAGSLHNYKVRAYRTVGGTKFYGAYSSYVYTSVRPAATSLKSLSSKSKAITVKYSKISTASGYVIQYSTSSSFSSSATKNVVVSGCSNISKTIKSLKKGKKYYVRVRTYRTYKDALGKSIRQYGKYSNVKSIKVR